jgi:hypothetical protein
MAAAASRDSRHRAYASGSAIPSGYDLVWADEFDVISFRSGGPTNLGYARGQGIWTPAGNGYRAGNPLGNAGFGNDWFVDPFYGGFPKDYPPLGQFDLEPSVLRLICSNADAEMSKLIPKVKDAASGTLRPRLLSALITNSDSFRISLPFYRETRMRISPSPVAWPASWSVGHNRDDFPRNQHKKEFEIDDMESFGNPREIANTIHWHDREGDQQDYLHRGKPFGGIDFSTDFHRYGVLLTNIATTFYVDDTETFSVPHPPGSDPFQPMSHILDMSVGLPWQGYSGPLAAPIFCDIDYVRYYAPPSNKSAIVPPQPPNATLTWRPGFEKGFIPYDTSIGAVLADLSGASRYGLKQGAGPFITDDGVLRLASSLQPPTIRDRYKLFVYAENTDGMRAFIPPVEMTILMRQNDR